MKLLQMADPVRFPRMTTKELRETFLLEALFQPGCLDLVYVDLDRAVIGSAVPTAEPISLGSPPQIRSSFFCERRELGVLNVGGPGSVAVDGDEHNLNKLDCLYVGRGNRDVEFRSDNLEDPAAFYLLSYPAHAVFPVALVRFADMVGLKLGASATCNQRTIYKAVFRDGIPSCQLVMGFTVLDEGSNWNTIPPHTHMRRSEVYMYFDLDPAHRIMHLMGPPAETRHIVLASRNVVISPGWSVHAGVGTKNYSFCWGMGGENQAYDDMDAVEIAELR